MNTRSGDLYARTRPGANLNDGEVQRLRQLLTKKPTGTVTTPTITANQNNFPIPPHANLFRIIPDNVGPKTFTGFAGGTPGRLLFILNGGPQNLIFTIEDGASEAANRFLNGTAGNTTIIPAKIAGIIYDGADLRWRLVSLTP